MLCVRIEGHETELTPAGLARLVFEGKVDRSSVARAPGGTASQPLEQLLGPDHGEALTGELHQRIRLIGSLDSSAVDVEELCRQVESLCQWRLPHSPVAARFFWAAAWLNELMDRPKSAIEFYDAFLLMPAGESHLRLLALNNRGVLQIQAGGLDGTEDLARAAVIDCGFRIADGGLERRANPNPQSPLRNPHFSGLPAACFNLLNLINVAFGSADLLRTVDEMLTDFFARLSQDLRSWWLGEEEGGQKTEDGGQKPGDETPFPSVLRDPSSVVRPLSSILRDPTYRRLNTLLTRLAAAAHGLAVDLHRPMERPSSMFRRLSLWACHLNEESSVPGSPLSVKGQLPTADRELGSAEAAALLLSDHIPSCLTRQDHPLARLEPSLREELAVIESHLAAGQYELAKSRLLVQRRLLGTLEERHGLAALQRYVEAQVERIGHLQAQQEQLQLQTACSQFVSEVQGFCTLTDPGQAQGVWEDLQRRLERFRAHLTLQTGGEAIGLLDELTARAQRHAQEWKRDQIEKAIGAALLHVRQNRPSDWTVPVPESVYRALAQCRLHDPENLIEDWSALQEQLEAHQGRHYTHRVLSAWQSGVLWDRVEGDLIQALVHQPDQWLALAPLFGWQAEDGRPETGDWRPEAPAAYRLQPPASRVDRAGRVLERVLEQIGADAKKCLRLWQCVEMTLSPALAGRQIEAFDEARIIAERCLDHWPTGLPEVPARADPRHPVNRFLEACDKARRLIEAEQLLGARPPRLDEARQRLVGILQSGVNAREQLRRIVTGLYLAQFHEKDPPPVQRQVLAGLEAWVAKVPPELVPQIQGQEIVAETEKVRGAVAGRFAPKVCPA